MLSHSMVQYPSNVIRRYEGFRYIAGYSSIEPGYWIVIAWCDGDTTLWLVDGKSGLDNLQAYYKTEYPANAKLLALSQKV